MIMNKEVLLIQPNYKMQRDTGVWYLNPPLGLCYIASVLRENGFGVKILDANAEDLTPQQTAKKAKSYNLVGISLMTPAHNFAVNLAKLLPKDIIKVAGGPHVTGLPEEIASIGYIAVRGEGEQTMLEIVKGKKLENILGITYMKNDKIVSNPARPFLSIEEVNRLPFPARDLLKSNGVDLPYLSAATFYRPWSPIFTSRGCPFNCNFCAKKIFGYHFRARTPENVIKEMEFLINNYGVKEFDFYDDSWNQDLKRANKILDMIAEKNWDIHLRCSNGIRVNNVTEEFVKKFKKAGGNWISVGVESGNQAVLNKIPKGITLDMVRKAVKIIKKEGIYLTCFFMLGLIGDTKETMRDTIEFAKELNPDIAQFSLTTPYPGTRLYDMIKANGELLFNGWDTFHHTEGKMLYKYPGNAEPKVAEEMYKRAHKEYYLRLRYILSQIPKIKSREHFNFLVRGAKTILKM